MSRDSVITLCTAVALAALAGWLYAPITHFPFVDYDDDIRVLANPAVRGGISWTGIALAFSSVWDANWSPITWISHMLDTSLYARDGGGHHTTNLLLHAANVVLLFMALRATLGDTLRPACVAALLAVHPIHVESVAWVSERKGLLSSTFAFAALWCHMADLRRGERSRDFLALALFALGLMTKPMLVSLPFVALLLRRLHRHAAGLAPVPLRQDAIQLVPWFTLALTSIAITLLVQDRGGAIRELDALPLAPRVANALVASVLYLGKLLWPVKLAAFYPHPNLPGGTPHSALEVGGAAAFWLGVLAVVWRSRSTPLAVGVAWYWITLLPVLGLVQVGNQAMADRYAYLPALGIYAVAAHAVARLLRGRGRPLQLLAAAAGAALVVGLADTARSQIQVWRSSETLFRHAVRVTDANFSMHFNLANTLKKRGRIEEAIYHYESALAIHPGMARAHVNLANTLSNEGRTEQAIPHYRAALAVIPELRTAREALGRALVAQGDLAGSLAHYQEAVRLYPDSSRDWITLGHLLRMSGDLPGAANAYEKAAPLTGTPERWRAEARALREAHAKAPQLR
ncbi:MAG: tetratricopeptide repeat protein [Myxococcota bacterium]